MFVSFLKKWPPHPPSADVRKPNPFYRNLYTIRGIIVIPTITAMIAIPTGTKTAALSDTADEIGANCSEVSVAEAKTTLNIVILLSADQSILTTYEKP